jgi:hypothetical protein
MASPAIHIRARQSRDYHIILEQMFPKTPAANRGVPMIGSWFQRRRDLALIASLVFELVDDD